MFSAHIVNITDKVIFEGEAERVSLPGVHGEFEIADLHGPIAALLARGLITVRSDAMNMDRNVESGEEILRDAKHSLYKSIPIEQGVMRFDGKSMHVIFE